MGFQVTYNELFFSIGCRKWLKGSSMGKNCLRKSRKASKGQAWRKLENSEGVTSAERRFHGGEAPEKNLDFRAKIVKISNSE